MSENTNLHEIIAFFGDTKLNANPNFTKYKEHCPYEPYGVIMERTYRARLSDITSNLDKIKQAFTEAGKQFHNDIFIIVKLSFLKEKSGRLNICFSASPYVAFCDSDSPQYIEYCGDTMGPIMLMTEDAAEAEKCLEDLLKPENILRAVPKALKPRK